LTEAQIVPTSQINKATKLTNKNKKDEKYPKKYCISARQISQLKPCFDYPSVFKEDPCVANLLSENLGLLSLFFSSFWLLLFSPKTFSSQPYDDISQLI